MLVVGKVLKTSGRTGGLGVERDLKVVLIEDDPTVAAMYSYRLEIDGYTVTIAADGEAGLRLATETQPDLIYLDLRLPDIDGFAVLERLRAAGATEPTRVVILTGYGEPTMIEGGRGLGALDFLVKPETSPTALVRRMEEWLGTGRVSRRPLPAPTRL